MPWDDTSAGAAVDDSEDDDSDPSNYFSLPKLLPGLKDLLPPAGVPDNPAAKYSPEVERLRPWALSQSSNPADAETWLQGAQTDLDQQAATQPKIKSAADPTSQGELDAQGPIDDTPLTPGNIDLTKRPRVKTADGDIATVRSISIEDDGKEVLIPTVSDDGRLLSNQQAIDLYRQTGKHLGIFDNADAADKYAESLHQAQAATIANDRPADTANDARIASNAAADAEAASEAGKHSNNPVDLVTRALNPISPTSLLGRTEASPVLNPVIPKITPFIQNTVRPAAAAALRGTGALGASDLLVPGSADKISNFVAGQIPSRAGDIALAAAPVAGEAAGAAREALAGSETAQRIGSALADETGAVRVPGGKVVPEPGAINSAQRQLQWLKDNTKDADLSADAKKLVDVLDPQTAALSMAKDPAFVPGDSNAVKTWLEEQAAQQKATPGEYGAAPPESLVANPHAPAVDAATGEHILYHGTAGPLEGDQLKQDSFLTPHREDAQTIAHLQSRLTGGEPNVVELRAHPDAVRPMNESQSFAASRGAMQVSDPNGVRVVNPEAPTPIRPDVQVEPPASAPPRFTDSVLNAVQQSKGYSDADMAVVKRLGNDPMEAMQFTIDNPQEAARLKPILADAVEAQRQSDSGLASGFHRDTAVVRNRASEMSSRMEAAPALVGDVINAEDVTPTAPGPRGYTEAQMEAAARMAPKWAPPERSRIIEGDVSDAAQGNANDTKALPRGAAGENGPGGRAPNDEFPVTPGASPANGVGDIPPDVAAQWKELLNGEPTGRFNRLQPGDAAARKPVDAEGIAGRRNATFGAPEQADLEKVLGRALKPDEVQFLKQRQAFESGQTGLGSSAIDVPHQVGAPQQPNMLSGESQATQASMLGSTTDKPGTLEIPGSQPFAPEVVQQLKGITGSNSPRLADQLYAAGKQGIRNFSDLLNAPITTATFGHAPLFRQGIGVAVSHPFSAWAPALKGFYTILRNPENLTGVRLAADEAVGDLPEAIRPETFAKGNRTLNINAATGKMVPRSDPTFVRQMLEKVGLAGNRMQEAASQYLDSLRKFAYKTEADRLWASGVREPAEYEGVWNSLSHSTGFNAGAHPDLNINPAFSWQALKGRFLSVSDIVTQPGAFNPLAPGAKSVAMRNLIGIAGFGTTVMALDQLTGGKANWNIGVGGIKTKVGLTTLDPYAGMGSIVRLFAGAEQAVQQGVQNGETPEQTVQGMVPLVTNFARGQISPGYQYIASLLTGKDWKQRDVSWAQSTRNLLGDSAPIAAKSIYDAVTENLKNGGPNAAILGGLRALPGLGALGVETNQSLTDVRDKATTTLGLPDKTDPSKKAGGYNDLTPANQMRVNAQDDVKSYQKANPTTYDTAKAQELDPIAANQAQYEQAFKDGTLTKPITDLWHDTGVQKAQAMKGLVDTYLSGPNFTGNADAFRKDINDYFNQTSNNADTTVNWEATDAAQQKFLATLPPTRAAAVKDYLAASQENQTPLRQQYLDYVSKKDAAGYYKPDVTAAQRTALDAKNPELDALGAYFSSGQKDQKPSALQSASAVSVALQQDPSKQYHLQGMTTAVNATAGTQQAFTTYGKRASDYLSGALVERNQDSYAQNLYGKKYASLTQAQQTSVSTRIKDAAIKSAPDLEAYLAWMGERQTISQAAEPYLQALRQKYGKETVDQPIRLQ